MLLGYQKYPLPVLPGQTCRMHLKEHTSKILQGRLKKQKSRIVLL